ncbi:primosomal protein N' family DNA-binding protein, partial [Geodermatophilus chilensis]
MARVVVDVPLAHLDRPFDYAVPDALADEVRAGCRVRVRFAGQLVDGFVLELTDVSESGRKLAPLAKVVSAEPVLTPEVVTLARAVAERWGGTVTDVLRLAVPPRRVAAEKRPPAEPP